MAVVWNLCLGPGEWVARYQVIVSMIYATSWDGKYSRQAFYGAYLDWLSDRQRDHFLAKGLVRRVGADEAAGIDPLVPVLTGDDARHAIPADAPVDLNKDDETPATAGGHCRRKLRTRAKAPTGAGHRWRPKGPNGFARCWPPLRQRRDRPRGQAA
jgi:hypothetical protein